ncbi:MAG TPA: DUF5990 family protein [Gemmatimonadaceae bacterium]|nr:DUF5990 family protein [Gemmatimonadaceae bacterium]
MKSEQRELPLRIIVRRPPGGVTFALQRGKTAEATLVAPSRDDDFLSFEFPVRVDLASADSPRFLGEFTQGPPESRFVYVNSGKHAGQPQSPWDRRAKIPLAGITAALIQSLIAARDSVLEFEVEGTGRDGGPVCATVKSSSGWHLAPR